jgi:hypothetical protein
LSAIPNVALEIIHSGNKPPLMNAQWAEHILAIDEYFFSCYPKSFGKQKEKMKGEKEGSRALAEVKSPAAA